MKNGYLIGAYAGARRRTKLRVALACALHSTTLRGDGCMTDAAVAFCGQFNSVGWSETVQADRAPSLKADDNSATRAALARVHSEPSIIEPEPDVVWSTPSKNVSGSMPLGNGNLGVNV